MRAALLLAAVLCSGACAIPNLVLEAGPGGLPPDGLHAPPQAVAVQIPAADGATLRGVWIPGEPGAPLVLQLMESTVGATEAARVHGLYWEFPAAGYATLALDYRGVAASGGTRNTDHLRDDARAMWREAVARAGGDPARVILRGGSLGALAAATLLQDGAQPGAVVLYGPVRAETVVRRFMVTGWAGVPRLPDALAPWLALLFRRPLAVDLAREIARCPAPVLVICGARDELLPPEESALLAAAAEAAAAGEFLLEDYGHVDLCTRHHRLHEEERRFLAARMPVAVDLAAREAALLAALRAAGAPEPAGEARRELRALVARRVGDPPAAVGALLAAGFPAERAARWLDADRAVGARWLAGRGAAEIGGLAARAEVSGAEDDALLAMVRRIWTPAFAQGLRLEDWALEGEATEARLLLGYSRAGADARILQRLSLPAEDLWFAAAAAEAASGAADSAAIRARLARWLTIAAAP